MDNRTTVIGLIFGVVVGAGAFRAAAPTAMPELRRTVAEATEARREQAPPGRSAGYRHGRMLLQEYLGADADAGLTALRHYDVDVLIATLPDPLDSHLDWAHDLYIEAIRRAFETSGFVTDRFWIPARRDTATLRSASASRPAREVYPSVFLFRGPPDRPRTLRLLYVVGELPTSGIYKEALQNALQERDTVLALAGDHAGVLKRRDVRIVGPTFSGSAPSLRLALDEWRRANPERSARIVSGAATDLANQRILTEGTNGAIWFHATVHPDATLDAVLRRSVLRSLAISDSEVAILRESSTQYGQGVASGARAKDGTLVITFPMNIGSLRTEYAQHARAAATSQRDGADQDRPRVPLPLQDSIRPKQSPPVHSGLTAPAIDLILDEIARTLQYHRIRVVGLQATDVRDKLFLADFLRRRLRDVQLFTFESNGLYLRTDYARAMRGMLVLSSYPLMLENQWWSGRADGSTGERLAFASDGSAGVYNATLMQLGRKEAMVEYGHPAAARGAARRPPVWLTVVGTGSFLPLRAFPATENAAYVAAGPELTALSPVPRRPLSLLAWGAWILLGGGIGVGAAFMLWEQWRSPRWVTKTLRKAPRVADPSGTDPIRPGGSPNYRRVEWLSFHIHSQLYRVLFLLALACLFLPGAALIWVNMRLFEIPSGFPTWWWALGWLAIVVGTFPWLAAVCVAAWRGLTLAWHAAGPGMEFMRREHWHDPRERVLWIIEVVLRLLVLAIGVVYFGLTVVYVAQVITLHGEGSAEFSLYFHRAVQLDSGVSPLPPLLLAAAGFAAWSLWHTGRISLLVCETTPFQEACLRRSASLRGERRSRPSPSTGRKPKRIPSPEEEVVLSVEEIRKRLWRIIPQWQAAMLGGLLLAIGIWLLPHFGRTLESLAAGKVGADAFQGLFTMGVLGGLAAIAWAIYRLLAVWGGLERFLRAIEATDLRTAFERLPPEVARLTRLSIVDPPARRTVAVVEATQWKQLHQIAETEPRAFSALAPSVIPHLELIHETGKGVRKPDVVSLGDRKRADAVHSLFHVLHVLWSDEPSQEDIDKVEKELSSPANPKEKSSEGTRWDTGSRLRRSYAGRLGVWLRLAEEQAAVAVVDYIEWVLRQLRRLALFLLLSLVFMTTLLSSYPFQPQRLTKLLFFMLLAATMASLVLVLNRMNRNELLSRITGTDPGRINWNYSYVTNLLLFVGIPVLTALSSEFPEVRAVLFSWVEPLVRTLAKG